MAKLSSKKVAYNELMNVVHELQEKTIDWKTQTFPDLKLNSEVLDFNEEIIANNYLKPDKYGTNRIVSGWYEKHTEKEIEEKLNYFKQKLDSLVQSKPFNATQGMIQFLEGDNNTKPYIAVELEDIAEKTTFKASMNKLRFCSLKQEIKDGERPFLAIRTILADYEDRNQAINETDCEF